MSKFFLVPGAEGWNLISRPTENGNWRVRAFPSLDDAAQTLSTDDDVVLALPISAVLAQRMCLPSVEGSELREMVRIQLEKALPFSTEEVTSDFEVIEQANGECVIPRWRYRSTARRRLLHSGIRTISRNSDPSTLGKHIRCASTAEIGSARTTSSSVLKVCAASSELGNARTRQLPFSVGRLIKFHPSAPGTRKNLPIKTPSM